MSHNVALLSRYVEPNGQVMSDRAILPGRDQDGIKPPIFPRRVDWYRQNRAFKIDKARKDLGYEPRVGIDEGLRRTVAFYRALFLTMDNQLARAEEEINTAIEAFGLTPPLLAYALAVLARIRLMGSTPDRAEAPARKAMAVLDELGGVEEGEAFAGTPSVCTIVLAPRHPRHRHCCVSVWVVGVVGVPVTPPCVPPTLFPAATC